MYDLLAKLMIITALLQLGMSVSDIQNSHTPAGAARIQMFARTVSHIDWRPISVFPEEAKRFR